jgi:adhesin/invasin
MKKIFLSIIATLFFTAANADVKGQALSKVSKEISEYTIGLIPGEGTTELDIQLSDKDDNDPTVNLLILRDIYKQERSNFFTQISLHDQDFGFKDKRYIGNFGLGYRALNEDNSYMQGINIFYDQDLSENHSRVGIGFEAKAGILDVNLNYYEPTTLQKTIDGKKEQVLGGHDYTLASQMPYMPWAKVNYTGYKHTADLASEDTKGEKYIAEMNLTSSLVLETELDKSGNGGDDFSSVRITFVHPPRNSTTSLSDGFLSNQAFYKKDMTTTLSEKVKRNNNLVIESQGAVIITKQ